VLNKILIVLVLLGVVNLAACYDIGDNLIVLVDTGDDSTVLEGTVQDITDSETIMNVQGSNYGSSWFDRDDLSTYPGTNPVTIDKYAIKLSKVIPVGSRNSEQSPDFGAGLTLLVMIVLGIILYNRRN
jgi:hypothetical protein